MTESAAPTCYVDANVLIYAVEGTDEVSWPLLAFLRRARGRPGCLCTSELTLAEVLAMPAEGSRFSLSEKRRLYGDLLLQKSFTALRPVSRDLLLATADLREATRHKLADAIHIVTAIETQCAFFLSSDAGFRQKRLPQPLIHVRPLAEELSELADQLNV